MFEAFADQISETQSNTESIVSAMNKTEAKKWEDWDRRDSQSVFTNDNVTEPSYDTSHFTSVVTKDDGTQFTNVSARQAAAHQKLIRYTRSAMTETSADTTYDDSATRGYTTATSASGATSALGTGTYGSSSAEATHFDTDYESDSMPDKSKLAIDTGVTNPITVETPPTLPSALSLNQRRILKNFCTILKKQGIEVLKQNRDSKWQVRYLTVSKELHVMTQTSLSENEGEPCECPIALLWVKRFVSRSVYSAFLIDKQGRGGVMLSHLVKVSATGRAEAAVQLPKKYHDKYKDSVIVVLEYNLAGSIRSMAVRCKTTADAHFLCTGMRVCMDVCKRNSDAAALENAK
jgi:hypothetical protein